MYDHSEATGLLIICTCLRKRTSATHEKLKPSVVKVENRSFLAALPTWSAATASRSQRAHRTLLRALREAKDFCTVAADCPRRPHMLTRLSQPLSRSQHSSRIPSVPLQKEVIKALTLSGVSLMHAC